MNSTLDGGCVVDEKKDMATVSKKIWTSPTIKDVMEIANDNLEGWLGNKMKLDKPDQAKVQDAMTKGKKPAEWYAIFDGNKLVIELRVGTAYKKALGTLDFGGDKDIEKKRGMLVSLNAKDKTLLPDKDLYKFQNDHPDPEYRKRVEGQATETKQTIETLKAQVQSIKTATWDNGQGGSAFREWVKSKHWDYFLSFLDDIDAKADPKKIFDKYIGDGTKQVDAPMNLSPGVSGPIQKALAESKAPNFAPARAEILKVVDTKFIPAWRAIKLPEVEKELKHKQDYLADLNATLAKK